MVATGCDGRLGGGPAARSTRAASCGVLHLRGLAAAPLQRHSAGGGHCWRRCGGDGVKEEERISKVGRERKGKREKGTHVGRFDF